MIRVTETASNSHQPLLWWSATELAALSGRMEAAFRDWLQQWSAVGSRALLSVCSTLAWEDIDRIDGTWSVLGARSSQQAWVSVGALGPSVSNWLFDRDATDRAALIAAALGREAAQDLLRAFRAALMLDTVAANNAPAAQLVRPWSGAVRIRIGMQDSDSNLHVLVNGAAAAAVMHPRADEQATAPPASPNLTCLSEACAGQSVRLDVKLTPCELEPGALRNLQPGDIVPLPHLLEVPLPVHFGGKPVCEGFLGRLGEAAAIELIRACAPPSTQASA
jgi:hypothetical protein